MLALSLGLFLVFFLRHFASTFFCLLIVLHIQGRAVDTRKQSAGFGVPMMVANNVASRYQQRIVLCVFSVQCHPWNVRHVCSSGDFASLERQIMLLFGVCA